MIAMPADILPSNAPALSATSDAPQVVDEAVATVETPSVAPVDTPPTPASDVTAPATPVESTETPGWARERFGTLAAQRREAEARAARLETLVQQQTEQMKALLETMRTPAPPHVDPSPVDSSVFAEPRPSRESFPDPESFESALVTWAGQKAAHEATAVMSKRAEEEAAQRAENERKAAEDKAHEAALAEQSKRATEIQTKWDERKAAAVERHADFVETIENPDLFIPVGSYVANAVLTREDGPEIGYYLGKNLDEARRISSLTVPGQVIPPGNPNAGAPMPDFIAQAFEIGMIAAKLAAAAPAPSTLTTETNALATSNTAAAAPVSTIAILPTPPTPITGAAATATQPDVNEMSMEEYAAQRMPQLRAERRPGRSIN